MNVRRIMSKVSPIVLAILNFFLAVILLYILYLVSHYEITKNLPIYLNNYLIQILIFPIALIPLSALSIYTAIRLIQPHRKLRLLPAFGITGMTIIISIMTFLCGYFLPPYLLDVSGEQSFKTDAKIVNSELDALPPLSQWKLYRNDALHIEIQYPPTNWTTAEDSDKHAYLNWETNGWTRIVLYRFDTTSKSPEQQAAEIIDKAGWNHNNFKLTFLRDDFVQLSRPDRSNGGQPSYVLLQKNQAILLVFLNYAAETGNAHVPEYIAVLDRGLNMVAKTIKNVSLETPNPTQNDENVNKIYGNQDFVVDYKLIDGIYVYDNPDNLSPAAWYDLHQYYPTDYGYGGEEQSSPKNKINVDNYSFQYGEVFSYPSNYYATLLSRDGKMYLKNYDQTPKADDLRQLLKQIDSLSQ